MSLAIGCLGNSIPPGKALRVVKITNTERNWHSQTEYLEPFYIHQDDKNRESARMREKERNIGMGTKTLAEYEREVED